MCKIPFIYCIESDTNVVGELSGIATEACCSKILIVDDMSFNVTVLERMLLKLGLSCSKAMNGLEALNLIKESQKRKCCGPIELVLMDCNMPVMDGYEATEEIIRLMSVKEIKKVSVVGVTAYTSSEHLDHCIKSGMELASKCVNSM